MKAAVYGGPGELLVRDVPNPELQPDNMLLRIRACTICGTDLKLFTTGNARCKPPRIIGHELVGEVVAVGDEVKGFAEGDRVTFATSIACKQCTYCAHGLENLCPDVKCISFDFDGGFAEMMAVPPQAIKGGNAIKVPEAVPDLAAALSEPLSCCVNAQKIAGVKAGDTVVVVGAGPLGCLNAEVAKAYGAHRVLLTQRSPERAALARKLANVDVLEVGDDAVQQVLAATDGLGADVVIASAPTVSSQQDALAMVRKGGVLSLFASLPKGGSDLVLDSRLIHYGQISVVGASDSRPCDVRDALALLAANKVDAETIVTHTLPLTDIAKGIEMMQNRQGLKIAIVP